MVNMCGPTFVGRLRRPPPACRCGALVAGFEAAREVLAIDALWEQVDALDGKAPAAGQPPLPGPGRALRGLTYWLARRARDGPASSPGRRLRPGRAHPDAADAGHPRPVEQKAFAKRAKTFVAGGRARSPGPGGGRLQPLTRIADLVDLAAGSSWPLEHVARLHHQVGAAFAIDRLRAAAGDFRPGDPSSAWPCAA
jgi:glutamate dehydrogenase